MRVRTILKIPYDRNSIPTGKDPGENYVVLKTPHFLENHGECGAKECQYYSLQDSYKSFQEASYDNQVRSNMRPHYFR